MWGESSQVQVLLLTPPFTQLNTPYPATAYIKGYLNTLGVSSVQRDLSLETVLKLFTRQHLEKAFFSVDEKSENISEHAGFVLYNKVKYLACIEAVVQFLQGKNDALAYRINTRNFLPEGHRFSQIEPLDWAFGELGLMDKAKYLATMFLEDLGDFITECVDNDFGFSRYAERLARTATSFDVLYDQLANKDTILCAILKNLVTECIASTRPKMVCITAPFPGNVFGAFLIAKTVKEIDHTIPCVLGGGYANTELRSLYDARVFDYVDYITLDDGELPLRQLIERHIFGKTNSKLKRTFYCHQGEVIYDNQCTDFDIPQREVGTPDFSDLPWNDYISVIEVLNPMHKMWSDGKWNKLTLAHGCYWGKCTFCDVSLDYISRYEPVTASMLCDRIEEVQRQTGLNGFHFVDEAAPPALMKELSIEIIKRRLIINWWTNIRFEKAFTRDVCKLLAESGCIAVTGGLEVASDRLLHFMKKGVTVEQVSNVAANFSSLGIFVHAYLMYGFPTQTEQETIDSLEIVRQLMEIRLIHSGYWHQFAMTAHSPVGMHPELYNVVHTGPLFEGFAENDYYHEDPSGANHESFSKGLHHAMFNYMNGLGFDESVDSWFSFKTPKTKIPKGYIKNLLDSTFEIVKPHHQILWIGGALSGQDAKTSNGFGSLQFYRSNQLQTIEGQTDVIDFLSKILPQVNPVELGFETVTVEEFSKRFEQQVKSIPWTEFLQSYVFYQLRESALLIL